jgi:hypothetical protein
LHDMLEKVYMELEGVSFMEQQMVDPGNISRSRQQVLALGCSSIRIYPAPAIDAWHVQYSSERKHGSSVMYSMLPKWLRPCTHSAVQ